MFAERIGFSLSVPSNESTSHLHLVPSLSDDEKEVLGPPIPPAFTAEQAFILANQADLFSVKRNIERQGGLIIENELVEGLGDQLNLLLDDGYEMREVFPPGSPQSSGNLKRKLSIWGTMERIISDPNYEKTRRYQEGMILQLLDYYHTLWNVDKSSFQLTKPQ